MFLKEVHLTRNHWSFKLLKFTFPWLSRFYNFCPHFWLTVLALCILPFTLTVYLFYYLSIVPFKWIIEKGVDGMDKLMESRFLRLGTLEQELGLYYEKFLESWDDDEKVAELRYYLPECEFRKVKKYRKMFNDLPYSKQLEIKENLKKRQADADKRFTEFLEYYKVRKEAAEKKKAEQKAKHQENTKAKAQRKSMVPAMMLAGKWLGFITLLPTAIFVIYWIILFLGWIWYWIVFYVPKVPWFDILGAILMVAVAGLTLFGLIYLIMKFVIIKIKNTFGTCIKMRKGLKIIFSPFILLGKIIGWMFTGIVDAAQFGWQGLKTFKSENCPAIIWEDSPKKKGKS